MLEVITTILAFIGGIVVLRAVYDALIERRSGLDEEHDESYDKEEIVGYKDGQPVVLPK